MKFDRLTHPVVFLVALCMPLKLASQWNHLDELYSDVNEITIHENDVFVGGSFMDAGGNQDADFIARWDGCNWNGVITGLNGEVRAIATVGNEIYIGGDFTEPFNHIAHWDGNEWHAMGSGLAEAVYSILVNSTGVYAGGGNWNSGFVALWVDNSWFALGQGLNGRVHDMVMDERGLIVGGRFSDVGGNPDADGVINWDGEVWQNLGLGVKSDFFIGVWDLQLYDSDIYAGGVFVSAGGNPDAHSVVKWDGMDWVNTGAGLGGFLGHHALTVFDGYLYTTVGAGWAADDGLYRYDFASETWEYFQDIELGPDDPMLVLTSDSINLYVGGYGMVIDGEDYYFIAQWGPSLQDGIVTMTSDNGAGSLRDIISCVQDGTTITFDLPAASLISLTSGEIIIDKNLVISGPGINQLFLSGNNASRIFHLLEGKTLTIENLTLKDSFSPVYGGAIFTRGDLVLKDVRFENNFEGAIRKSFSSYTGTLTTIMGNVFLQF